MSLNNPPIGHNFVPAYQISGVPWVTSSVASTTVTHIEFDKVTRFIQVKALGNTTKQINVAFSENGLDTYNFYPLIGGQTFEAEIRIRDLFLVCVSGTTAEYAVFAGTTTIPSRDFPILTGSTYDGGGGHGLGGIG